MHALIKYLRGSRGMVISYSGGLDSTFLAAVAQELIPGLTRCVLLDSPLVPRRTIDEAESRAAYFKIRCEIVPFPILGDEEFKKNPIARCYICKKRAAAVLWKKAAQYGMNDVVDGVNCSDYKEFRPGIRAADEEGIIHPLAECRFTKPMIRAISKERGYPFWDLTSAPCLATRIPYGHEITKDLLERIEYAEDFLIDSGFYQVRVRTHGNLARIEVPESDMPRLLGDRDKITCRMRELGFLYCTLDLEGIQSGSMDREIALF